jgi:hypothetical protein
VNKRFAKELARLRPIALKQAEISGNPHCWHFPSMFAFRLKAAGLMCVVSIGALAAGVANLADAAPVLPGLEGKHPLSQTQVGESLISELKCATCHRRESGGLPEKVAPDLGDVGSRVSTGRRSPAGACFAPRTGAESIFAFR